MTERGHTQRGAQSPSSPETGSGRARRSARGWLGLGLAVFAGLTLLAGLAGLIGLMSLFWYYGRDLEAIDADALRSYRPPQVTRILARDGELIGEIYTERRTFIPYSEIPGHVEDAFLAAEDADFYHHKGMDYVGMLRALVANLRAGEIRQGASTITQQVVKNFLLSPERTLERKVQELILARRLEEVLSKQEILELYLNSIYLGHGRYGIEEASRFYFGKSVRDVSVAEAAVLAALPKAPSTGSPLKDPKGAKARQNYVLDQMAKQGFLARADADAAIAAPLPGRRSLEEISGDPSQANGAARALAQPVPEPGAEEFVDLVEAELKRRYGDDLSHLGATVWTSVDLAAQRKAREGLREGLIALDIRRGYGHGIKPAKAANLKRAKEQGAVAHEVGGVYPIVIEARPPGVPKDFSGFYGRIGSSEHGHELNCLVEVAPGSRYDEADKKLDEQFAVGGITVARVVALPGNESTKSFPPNIGRCEIGSGPQAAVLVADIETGEIRAMVGGFDHDRGDFNRAVMARRQPGSSFKPFIYGTALEKAGYTPATIVSDSPEIYEKWKPTNFEKDVYRGDIRLRVALTNSVNTVAIKLLDLVGPDAVHDFARRAGIESQLVADLSLALGTSEVTPYEMLRGYLTLARGGSRIEPVIITRIEIPGQAPWVAAEDADRKVEQVIDPAIAYLLTSMMRSVVEEGTGQRAKALGRPVAGKTGTSAESRDAWFCGYTTQEVAVSWVGFDTPRPLGKSETGGKAATPIWLAAMMAVRESGPPATRLDFVPPPSVMVREIDPNNGLLAAIDGPRIVEYFAAGTEPNETSDPTAAQADNVVMDLYGSAPPSDANGEDAMAAIPDSSGVGEKSDTGLSPSATPSPSPDESPALPSVDDP